MTNTLKYTSSEKKIAKRMTFSIAIKWSGNEYVIDETTVNQDNTIADLRRELYRLTGVKPERQKLIGLKAVNKPVQDDQLKLGDLDLKPTTKIMMIGSKEKDIDDLNNEQLASNNSNVINDLDIPDEVEIAVEHCTENLAKIARRVKEYKVDIFNNPRPGKKLLVLDIDYTLFDHRSVASSCLELMRPYLHEFLTEAYVNYDIIIWSATSMKWIQVKMRELGVEKNPNYKIVCYLDSGAMISVNSPNYGVLQVKPLGVIWGKYSEYNPKNTIMIDDVRRNFLMNKRNGFKIRPYREALKNCDKDRELYYLSRYLKLIAEKEEDFTTLNHKHWQKYLVSHK